MTGRMRVTKEVVQGQVLGSRWRSGLPDLVGGPPLRSLDPGSPGCHKAVTLRRSQARLKAAVLLPGGAKVIPVSPDPDSETGEGGGAERGGFNDTRSDDGHVEDIGLDLEEEVVGRRTAVNAQLGERYP